MVGRPINEIPLNEITKEDLQFLIDEEITEKRSLEYKRELNLNTADDKKEFLADISSFANASGGDLIIGIECDSKTKLPKKIVNASRNGEDLDLQTIGSIIRDGIEPRIQFKIQPVYLSDSTKDEFALILRIEKGWNGPHRIKFRDLHRFYTRSPNGKYLMEINELRSAFNLSETRIEKIRSFIQERISNIYSDNLPFPMSNVPKLTLHLVPISSFDIGSNYDLSILNNVKNPSFPLGPGGCDITFNIDGILKYQIFSHEFYALTYLQYFRNGIIETTAAGIAHTNHDKEKLLYPDISENYILSNIDNYKRDLKILEVAPPFIIFISLIGVKDHGLSNRTGWIDMNGNPELVKRIKIHKDVVQLPDIYIEDYSQDIKKALKPCFDVFANLVGLSRSKCYDEDGNYIGEY